MESVIDLKLLYDKMAKHNVPYIDFLKKIHTKEGSTPFMIFTPKGANQKPQSKEQLIKALCCVLITLKVYIFIYFSFHLYWKRRHFCN